MSELTREEKLAAARRKLLEKRLRGQAPATETPETPPLPRHNADDPVPATAGQASLWYLQQLQPDSAAYNMANAVRLAGDLDLEALHRSLETIVSRHAILRTTFAERDGQLWQQIDPAGGLHFEIIDVAHESERATIERIVNQPFNLATGPLLRVYLLRLAPAESVLLTTMHHIIADKWSLEVLFWRELATCYSAYHAGDEPQLPAPAAQFADYSLWQSQRTQTDAYQRQLAYWRDQLADAPPLLTLPTDRPRPAVQRFEGHVRYYTVPADLTAQLQQLSRESGVTLFMLLLAAFDVLLHRYTSQNAILVGTSVDTRTHADLENALGYFLNTVVLREDFGDERPFADLLTHVRQQVMGAFSHQEVEFEQIVQALQPRRDPSYNPIFQTMFVMWDAKTHLPQLPDLTLTPFKVDPDIAKFDLTFYAQTNDDGTLMIAAEYATALFDAATIEQMQRHFHTLLAGIAADPQTPITRLPLLTAAAQNALLAQSAPQPYDYPRNARIHDLIAAQDGAHDAIWMGEARLTYADLNRRANQVAHHLIAAGITAGIPVGLCVRRSPEMLIGMLAILKAGGAYVPIDPDYPPERVAYMLSDAGITLILTQSDLLPMLTDESRTLIALDGDFSGLPDNAPQVAVSADDLAYIIYTSGSTGRPKGVRITHRNLVHSTAARTPIYQAPVGRFLLLSSFAFDSSLVGLFWTLCSGGTLCLPPPDAERDVAQIAGLIARYEITHLLALPSLYQVLLDFSEPAQLTSLRVVIVAGEACPLPLVQQHYDRLPDATLYNEYGPTEGTVWSTVWRVPQNAERMTIGSAIPNMGVYLLDAGGQPVPQGVAGEIVIGGDGIAQGYHGRPELTAGRFIDNPFGEGRLYRTGDLGRRRADGLLEFLGRVDHQVKISGYRIELGEIESALVAQDAVREAVVIVTEAQAIKQLAAFVVGALDVSALTAALRAQLPRYMVPAQIIALETLPRTPNGKIDRAALRAIATEQTPATPALDLAQASAIEQQLVTIWRDLLKREIPDLHANFFDLGGYSLLAIRMFAQIRQTFERDLPVSLIMEAPTIAGLARHLAADESHSAERAIFTLQPEGDAPPLYCLQVHKWGIVTYRYLATHIGTERPVYGLAVPQDRAAPETIEDVAALFIDELLAQQPEPPYYLSGMSIAGLIAYEMARQLAERGIHDVHVILFDTYGPGYPDWLPPRAALAHRAAVHWQKIRAADVDMGWYLREVAWRWRQRIGFGVGKIINRWRVRLGLPLPERPVDPDKQAPAGVGPVREFRGRKVTGEDAMLMVMQEDYFAAPRPYTGDITLYRATMQPWRTRWLEALGWEHNVTGDIHIQQIRGTHSAMLREPHIVGLVDALNQRLRQLDSN